MKIGINLDDVVAECAVPYLRKFAQEFGVDLPPNAGWQTLAQIEDVPAKEKDRFRIETYDGTFFRDLEMYVDCPAVLERRSEERRVGKECRL